MYRHKFISSNSNIHSLHFSFQTLWRWKHRSTGEDWCHSQTEGSVEKRELAFNRWWRKVPCKGGSGNRELFHANQGIQWQWVIRFSFIDLFNAIEWPLTRVCVLAYLCGLCNCYCLLRQAYFSVSVRRVLTVSYICDSYTHRRTTQLSPRSAMHV